MHSILGVLGPSSVTLYLDRSDRATYRRKVLVTPRFSKHHLFMVLTLWERLFSSRFHELFCNGFHLSRIQDNPVTGGLNDLKSLSSLSSEIFVINCFFFLACVYQFCLRCVLEIAKELQ